MRRIRSALADVLVGIVVVLVALWLLRGVFRFVYWAVTMVVLILIIGFVLRIASRLRR